MRLFELEDEMPVFSPEARTIKEFNAILRRDRGSKGDHDGRKKQHALKELSFIHFYCTFDSRFELYETEEERNEAIKVAVGLSEEWQPDDLIVAGIRRYTDMMQTESMGLVKQARSAIKKFEEYLETVDLNERNIKSGTLVHDSKKYRENVNGIPEMIENLNKSKKIVQKELEDLFGKASKKQRSLAEIGFADNIEGEI